MKRGTLLLIVASAFACSSDSIPGPPDGLPHSAAFRDCGPTDGPAVAIVLGSEPIDSRHPPTPYVRLQIPEPLEEIAGRSRTIGEDAAAWYFSAPNQFEVASTGSVSIESVRSDSTVVGSARLWFPNRGRINGAFTASWINVPMLCG